ncbi:hypothetical protein FGG08_004328 [Glutinoglossum americanum]|uniref:Uncharacterized protein n=1 Tax=Glutinoglossum americanum TaxID=1670608 RepID=A0A9P8I5W5_9PEZI|nr:hypothetical protein FGG08_004328 [Glutinoglossum americanum]
MAPASFGRHASPLTPHYHCIVKRHDNHQTHPTPLNLRRYGDHRHSSYGRVFASPSIFDHHGHHKSRSMDSEPLDSRIHSKMRDLRQGHLLQARYKGDRSAEPLEVLKREARRAHRSPHLQRKHLPGPDTVDWLDESGALYHHEGPYDATLLARNTCLANSPVEAVKTSNEEALKATPREKITDALEKHRPLDGVAVVRSGARGLSGQRMEYEEGSDLMVEDGNYKRWPGVEYLPGDRKGKGEPSYTIEKSLKGLKSSRPRRGMSEPVSVIELTDLDSTSKTTDRNLKRYRDCESSLAKHSNSTKGRLSGGFRRRFGNLMGKKSL